MKSMLMIVALACVGLWVASSFVPRGKADADVTPPGVPAAPGTGRTPDIRPGDQVRVILNTAKPDYNWLGGVVKTVDADHITVSGLTVDQFAGADGNSPVTRPVEHWVPMTSVLYLEKFTDSRPAAQVQP